MKLRVELAGLTPLNGCRCCGEDFTSLRSFDRHHVVGVVDDEEFHRCLDHDEMQALGWRLNPQGRWVDGVAADKARDPFSRATERLGAPARDK